MYSGVYSINTHAEIFTCNAAPVYGVQHMTSYSITVILPTVNNSPLFFGASEIISSVLFI